MFKLTEHQQDVLNKSIDILTTSNRLLVSGSAGVGKTTLVNELIKELSNNRVINTYKQIYCSAPTNKAVAVLKNKVDQLSNLEFITVHSALKLKRQVDYKTGNVTFKPYYSPKYPPLQNAGLLVVDETSMLNSELLDYIEEAANTFSVKVVFIGDAKQLNPVGEEESPVFHRKYPEVELTEIIRQGKENPIINLSRNLSLIGKEDKLVVKEDTIGYLHSKDYNYMLNRLAEVNGSDDLKYLSWTNKDVDTINDKVRQLIYGTPKRIEIGESIIFNSPYEEKYFTNEELKVGHVEVVNKLFKVITESNNISKSYQIIDKKFKCYLINNKVLALHEDSDKDFRVLKSQLLSNCKARILEWADYYSFLDKLADFKYNHALTVHKSQGSTYKKAIINVGNLNLNKNQKEKQRLFYTAVTRASNLLILYNT